MIVELEFLDMSKTRVHEKTKIYENFSAPIPNVGDTIYIEGYLYKVNRRDFIYLDNTGIDLKVSFWCEELN
ncbi:MULTISPECIES: hypothetical protein [Bacillus]|uniref:hypothetical protein n=1 Tax=Bacillus TaxID=1386 RepID=UPI000B5DA5CC|nr:MULTISPECIES: hypothetical protein [Bacillus]OXB98925.1 hypothetical protein CGQ22_10155 [Bacillus sp. M13(2017)]QCY64197.1 hypothetical protein FHE73_26915 [Bacillus thuringiensis]